MGSVGPFGPGRGATEHQIAECHVGRRSNVSHGQKILVQSHSSHLAPLPSQILVLQLARDFPGK